MYFQVNHASGYIEGKSGNKYLILIFVDEKEEVSKIYNAVWDGIKNKIKWINEAKVHDYEKDDIKVKFNSDHDLPLNKPLKFYLMTTIIRSIFEEDGKLYPQVFLDDALYELQI